MTDGDRESLQNRVLVLAPTPKDAMLTRAMFDRAGIASVCCSNLRNACDELENGAGAMLLAEEAVASGQDRCLTEWLASQPAWSDLPVLLLARPGARSATVAHAMRELGNVTVLERPTRVAALVSAIRTALRARQRQYEIREQLAEREQAAEVLRERVEDMQTLMDTLPVGVLIAQDPDSLRITGNRAAADLLRMNPTVNFSKTAPPAERPTHFRVCKDGVEIPVDDLPVQRAARGETVRHEEVDHVFDDGTVTHTLTSASPVYRSDGELRGAVAAILDVTEQKRAEAALRDADRRKDEFLATLAHELRNPLAPIRNSLHILRLGSQHDPAVDRVSEMMERQVNHMVRLVDDLLEVSRITRGKIELRKESIEVAAIVRSAVETSRPLIEAAGHQLVLAIPSEPVTLEADPVRLTQVVANLLNNAAKYSNAGGRIWLAVRTDGETVEISVRDAGIGIPPDMLARVFEPFMQVDRHARNDAGGLGIGLSLVKSLVELHGGSVRAESDGPNRGAEFVVSLPLATARRPAHVQPALRPTTVLAKRRVLVVDDSHDAAESLGTLLKLLGADVHVAYNGPDALDAFATYKPAVVLLDIGMPGMDGHEVARRMRQRPESQDVTIIALTGWGQPEDRHRSESAGFDYHLIKPADANALQSLLVSLEGRPGSRGTRH